MVMDMGRDAEQAAVELEFQPVVKDFSGLLKERRRITKAGRRSLWVAPLVMLIGVAEIAGSLAGQDTSVPVACGLLAGSVAMWFMPHLQGRAFQRLAARNGVMRTVVTDDGVTVSNANTTTTVRWPAQPRYRETADLFVMFSDDKNASCFTVLPKRGLADPADADRLRAIFDRHLARI
ncbi:YcxB family protein [Streptomyces mangrovisoli]|uniref:YcxB-like C-terminal domain-containing protein n=1 Tax=Streptomyces mangrovisoli TaxID=1428628 RepID=A0A1J4NR35_9ACTN|nr:YcxB family protein [Streptomyces mangrovisoli]OIJ64905.1 hypothetical protein WN71_026365 [Streptomyces mangrovisoli]